MRGTIISKTKRDGSRRFIAVLRINGKQKWVTFETKAAAEDYLDRHSVAVREGCLKEIRTGATFADYAKYWKETYLIASAMKPGTFNSYESIFDKHIEPAFKNQEMLAIGTKEIKSFTANLQKKKLSAKTIRNILNLLSKIFSDAVEDQYLRQLPLVKKPPVPRKRKSRALKPAEIQALLANAGDKQTRLIILIGVLSGMRRGEIFGLRWEDLDFDSDLIMVQQALHWLYGKHIRPAKGEDPFAFLPPKMDSVRDIDLSPVLKKELLDLQQQRSGIKVSASGQMIVTKPKGLIFCTTEGRPLDPNGFQKKEFSNAVIAAQIGAVRFHDLRHTFGSVKLELGESAVYVSKQMGHSSVAVTLTVYAHLLEAKKPEAARRTDAFIFGEVKPRSSD